MRCDKTVFLSKNSRKNGKANVDTKVPKTKLLPRKKKATTNAIILITRTPCEREIGINFCITKVRPEAPPKIIWAGTAKQEIPAARQILPIITRIL